MQHFHQHALFPSQLTVQYQAQVVIVGLLQTFDWLQAMLRITLAPGLPEGTDLPLILCYDELESMDTMMWLGMDNVIIVNDRYAMHRVAVTK